MFPLEAKSKLPMNCTELMFQIKTKRKRRKKKKPTTFKHCFVEFFVLIHLQSNYTLVKKL